MKYGQHLREHIAPEYGPEPYLDYARLDGIIRDLSSTAPSSISITNLQVSLTTPPPTNAQGMPQDVKATTDEVFYAAIDSEINKVETFTLSRVVTLRQQITDVELQLKGWTTPATTAPSTTSPPSSTTDLLRQEADEVAASFLRLEKYVNINFKGFYKILKKHDKYLVHNPCRNLYVARLHSQAWVRGDYSDVVVRLSAIYESLRTNDTDSVPHSPPPPRSHHSQQSHSQQFLLNSTTKYWVKTEDVSRVKYAILKHLPVQLQNTSTGESDSQLTNSVYFDNDLLELYHGRLANNRDESISTEEEAIALRLRWYGSAANPSTVFVERETHRSSGTGEVNSKERFEVKDEEVELVMNDTLPTNFPRNIGEDDHDDHGNDHGDNDERERIRLLSKEITQVIASKQLVPTMRTQFMRTAFQIPFVGTVRVNLDTNLCMVLERGYDANKNNIHGSNNNTPGVWHRDHHANDVLPLRNNEITRFPHAVLEIKLQLPTTADDETNTHGNANPISTNAVPQWVLDLQNSGLLYQVHKFSNFLHGCATLLPDDVRSIPYWVDDESLKESIIASGAERILLPTNMTTDSNIGNNGPGELVLPPIAEVSHSMSIHRSNSEVMAAGVVESNRTQQDQRLNNTESGNNYYNASNGMVGSNFGVKFYSDADMDEEEIFLQEEEDALCCGEDSIAGWLFPFCSPAAAAYYYDSSAVATEIAPTATKIEPKVFFANERTYLHWLHAGVILYTIATGILAFSSEETENWAHWYAMLLLPLSLAFCLYGLHVFLWRADRIKTGVPVVRWDDPRGPIMLGSTLVIVLLINFFAKVHQIATYVHEPEL